MQFKCDSCGAVVDVPNIGATDGGSVSDDASPPDGFRTIYTVIEEHDGSGLITTSGGEVLHSCAECNARMTVEEHHEAELEWRKRGMQKG